MTTPRESSKVTTDMTLQETIAMLEKHRMTPKPPQSNLIMEVIRTFTDDRGIPMSTDEFMVLKHRIEEVL